MKLRVCTLFSGYDSQCMALDRLKEMHPEFDYELVAWAEIDKYAIQAHNAVYPQWSDRNYGDVSKIDWNQVPDFDLLTYSSPCQDFSNAGKQAGGEEGSGTRSSLLWEVRRAILAKKPKYMLMENVAALVSKKFIGQFKKWQLELSQYGYTNFSQVLNAKNYGVPQNRERIFMVSVLNCTEGFYFPTPIPLEKRLKDVLEENVEERYYLSDKVIESFNAHAERHKEKGNGFSWKPTDGNVVANCVLGSSSTRNCDNFIIDNIEIVGHKHAGQSGVVYGENGIAPTITTNKGDGQLLAETMIGALRGRNPENPSERGRSNGKYKQRLELNENHTSNTITSVQKDNVVVESIVLGWSRDKKGNVVDRHPVEVANCVTAAKRDNTQNFVVEPTFRIRKLTERECFRLMGVIDTDSDKIRAAVSKSQCYKLAGNSIVVDVMVGIFEQLLIGNKNTNQQLEIF